MICICILLMFTYKKIGDVFKISLLGSTVFLWRNYFENLPKVEGKTAKT